MLNQKPKKLLSQRAYLKANGNKCPVCGGRALESGDIRLDESNVFVADIECFCGAKWIDVYQLSGYKDLNLSDYNPQEAL